MNFIRIGRKRLELKLPRLRTDSKIIMSSQFDGLFEAYGLAVVALERFLQNPEQNGDRIREYQIICREIEEEFELIINK